MKKYHTYSTMITYADFESTVYLQTFAYSNKLDSIGKTFNAP